MTVSAKEILPLVVCLAAIAALWVVYERIPVTHLEEDPAVTCINDAAKNFKSTNDFPISAACPGF